LLKVATYAFDVVPPIKAERSAYGCPVDQAGDEIHDVGST